VADSISHFLLRCDQMKEQLRKVARKAAGWPLIGRLVHIGVGIVRLPQIRESVASVSHRQHVFEVDHMPALLRTLSSANKHQIDLDNLVHAMPMTLRKHTRDLTELTAKVEALLSDVASLRDQVSHNESTLNDRTQSIDYLLGRVEFVRRELMFEMRYGAREIQPDGDAIEVKAEILSQDKLEAARRDGIRLNLGCGHVPLDGYLNVDRRALPGVDVVSEVDGLPFGKGELTEIFSAHLLEHFPEEQLRRELLPYFFGLLAVGGELKAIVPDAEAMIREYTNGTYPYEDLREVLYGGQDYDGDFHFNMFTPESMVKLLTEAGFETPTILERGRKNGRCYEFEITARKPAANVQAS
jgi:predicted SAM-dependent methyltransferase